MKQPRCVTLKSPVLHAFAGCQPACAAKRSRLHSLSSSPAFMYSRSAFLPAWVMDQLSAGSSNLVQAFEALSLDEKLKVLRSMDARDRQQTTAASTPAPASAGQGSAGSNDPAPPPPPTDPMGETIASEDYTEPTLPASRAKAAQPSSRSVPE